MKVVKASGIKIHIKETTSSMSHRLAGLMKCLSVAKFLKSLEIDLIHSMHYSDDYSEALAAKFAGIPWIYTKKNMNWGGKSKNSWLLRSLLSKHILVQNRDMIKEFFPKSSKTTLVPRGVNTKEFYPMKKNSDLLEKFSLSKKDKVILCVANLAPVKGVEVLINAFELLCRKYKNIKLIIVGYDKNNYAKKLRTLANSKDCHKKIFFTGKVYNVQDYYSISDIFVLPTLNIGRREGCPVSLLEAMASGIAVMASNISGIKDVLQSFPENMFSPGHSDILSIKIESILNNEISNKENLLKYVRDKFDIKEESRMHEIIYKKVLNFK